MAVRARRHGALQTAPRKPNIPAIDENNPHTVMPKDRIYKSAVFSAMHQAIHAQPRHPVSE